MAVTGETDRLQAGIEGQWICVGAFAGSYGVRGDVRLKSFTADPVAIFSYPTICKGPGGPLLRLVKVRDTKEGFIVRVDGLTSPEDAQALKGQKLYVRRDDLPDDTDPDAFYLADLIGLKAMDTTGQEIGFVRAVENFGADDLLELVLPAAVKGLGRNVYIPFSKAFVPDVDLVAGTVTIAFDAWLETQQNERPIEECQ